MKEKVKRKLDNFFEKIVEFYIYWAIIWLISYMVSTLFIKFYNFIELSVKMLELFIQDFLNNL